MNKTAHTFRVFADRDAFCEQAALWISGRLEKALKQSGKARIGLSGGSTPRPIYERLSNTEKSWSNVKAVIVDERVGATGDASNETMIRDKLIQNKAAGLELARQDDPSLYPLDISVLGMGTDGHTASWFPGSDGLKAALDPFSDVMISTIDASGCPGAGDYAKRQTLTLPAIMNSREVLLLITGKEKLEVFEAATTQSVYDAPVKALLAAGNRLTVMWAA